MYEFKMALFKNGNPEEFLPFVKNLKMTNERSGMLAAKAKLWYLRTILCGKVLRKFETLCLQIGSTTMMYLNQAILGLGKYFPHINVLPQKKYMMHHGMRKLKKLKLRHYTAFMVWLNEYLTVFPGEKANEKLTRWNSMKLF